MKIINIPDANTLTCAAAGSATSAVGTCYFTAQKYRQQLSGLSSLPKTLGACAHREFWRRFTKVALHNLQIHNPNDPPPALFRQILTAAAASSLTDMALLKLELAEKKAATNKVIPHQYRLPLTTLIGVTVGTRAALFGPTFLLMLDKTDKWFKAQLAPHQLSPLTLTLITGTLSSTCAGVTGSIITQIPDKLASDFYNHGCTIGAQPTTATGKQIVKSTIDATFAALKADPKQLWAGLGWRSMRFSFVFAFYKFGYEGWKQVVG
jgi:hypothetical protein